MNRVQYAPFFLGVMERGGDHQVDTVIRQVIHHRAGLTQHAVGVNGRLSVSHIIIKYRLSHTSTVSSTTNLGAV